MSLQSQNNSPRTTERGFTLIELAIVLVIIGLVIGGVMVARNLIYTATIRKVVSQSQEYITAVNTFRLKYNSIPGDMPNATSFWGNAGDCASAGTSTLVQTATCDGNGNGMISGGYNGYGGSVGPGTGTIFNGFMVSRENFTFWQQLANAGLINGSYSGSYVSPPLLDTNIPSSAYTTKSTYSGCCHYSKLAWMAWSQTQFIASYNNRYPFPPYTNVLTLASINLPVGGYIYWMGMLAIDAYDIDTKLDDGKANTGKIRGVIPDTVVAAGIYCYVGATGAYATNISTGGCQLDFINAF